MKEFFKVTDLETALQWPAVFPRVKTESLPLAEALGRVLGSDICSDINLPDFPRAIMDGYAVKAASTFGASEGNPAYLNVVETIHMGEAPTVSIKPGETAKISTGGMLPKGTDSVVMIEHTDVIDDVTIEVYRSVAPGQHIIQIGEDLRANETILSQGQQLRPQEIGILAALGIETVSVYRQPIVGIISTGDEIVPVAETPILGQIRDINSYTLSGQVVQAGGVPVRMGIVGDDFQALRRMCETTIEQSDMIFVSGGSSVGMRDFTIEVLSTLPDSEIMAHGISISPGKPTILASVGGKLFCGLPGHVASAMVVFHVVMRPFLEHVGGKNPDIVRSRSCFARLKRNLASKQGRVDCIRVKLHHDKGELSAEPILGKSGLIHTMIKADGLVRIDKNTEGLDKGAIVEVDLFAA
jgi:molybdopterin molybdotransferase